MGSIYRHKQWRKTAKKIRRKKIRTLKAKERDELLKKEEEQLMKSQSYQQWLMEADLLEKEAEEEEQRRNEEVHKKWLEEDTAAVTRWEEAQEKLAQITRENARKALLIKEEWEREEKKRKEQLEKKKKLEEEKKREQELLLTQIDDYIKGERDEIPEALIGETEGAVGTKELCQFFIKTGACRFRESCSRRHPLPKVSKTILIPGLYSHYSIQSAGQDNEYDTDVGLEFEHSETYHHFVDFYVDIISEFERYGNLTQVKVCCNKESHLRGNVYIVYESFREALRAYKALHGRWYAGKQITPLFINLESWKRAICGLFGRGKCPKGSACNFLHVFRNPGNAFRLADLDLDINKAPSEKNDRWRWSESPERRLSPERVFKKEDIRQNRNREKRRRRSRSTSRSRTHGRRRKRERSSEGRKHRDKCEKEKKNKNTNKYSKENFKHKEIGEKENDIRCTEREKNGIKGNFIPKESILGKDNPIEAFDES